MMNDHLDNAIQRTKQYWNIDGIAELVVGAIFVVLGAYFLIQSVLPPQSLLSNLLTGLFVLLILGSGFLGGRVIDWIKTRITYPRTGYIAPSKNHKHRWIAALMAILIAAVVSALIITSPVLLDWVPAITGIFAAAILTLAAYRNATVRIYILAGISLLLGTTLSLLTLEDNYALAAYYGLMGLAGLISGGITLITYLQNTIQDVEDNQEGII
jgi:hypothetical protein